MNAQAGIDTRLQGFERHFVVASMLRGLAQIIRRTFQVTMKMFPLHEGSAPEAALYLDPQTDVHMLITGFRGLL